LKLRTDVTFVQYFAVKMQLRELLVKYSPWHANRELATMPAAKDENGNAFAPWLAGWLAGPGSWPVDGFKASGKIEPGKSIIDVVAFAIPSSKAEEIEIKLPADNFGMTAQWFHFKIVPTFYRKK
jgi:hypothetical protein